MFVSTGEIRARNGLALFCALVGICWTTCYGDARFGTMGFVLGPAALVVTWEVFARRSAARSPNRMCR